MLRSVALFALLLVACGGQVAFDPEGIETGGLGGTSGSGASPSGGATGGSGADASGGVGAWIAGGSGGWAGTGALGGVDPAGGGGGLDPVAAVCDGVWQLPCSGYASLEECMSEMAAAEQIAVSLGCEDGWSPFMTCADDYPGSCHGVEYVPDPSCAEPYDALIGCLDPPESCVLTGVESSNCTADCGAFGASCRLFDTLGTVQCTCSYGPNTNLFFFLDSCQELSAAVLTRCG